MALFRQFRGNRASLDAQPLHDGYAYFCVDDGTFHIDCTDADGNLYRKQINAKDAETLCGMTLEELGAKIDNQNVVVLSESQAYTDAKLAEMIVRLEALEKLINNSPLVDGVEGVGTLDAGTILDTDPSEINIIDPNTTT